MNLRPQFRQHYQEIFLLVKSTFTVNQDQEGVTQKANQATPINTVNSVLHNKYYNNFSRKNNNKNNKARIFNSELLTNCKRKLKKKRNREKL